MRNEKGTMAKVAKSSPIDKTARMVTSPGVHYEPFAYMSNVLDAPPAMQTWPYTDYNHIMGKKYFGQLTVLGKAIMVGKHSKDDSWVCRCVCGKFCQVKARTLLAGTTDKCNRCRWREGLSKKEVGRCERCNGATHTKPLCHRCVVAVWDQVRAGR